MKNKAVSALAACCAALCAFALAGCAGGIDLESGAIVVLNVHTEAPAYVVTSTYGAVSREGEACVVTLERKRDILVTVSAENYKTVNLRISAAQMADGKYEEDVYLRDKTGKLVRITLTGSARNAKAVCAGGELKKEGNVLSGEFPAEDLAEGILVTADGAEPFLWRIDTADLSAATLERNIDLIPEGKRALESGAFDTFAADKDGRILARADTNGDLLLDKSFTGEAYIYELGAWNEAPRRVVVTKDSPAYMNEGANAWSYRIEGVSDETAAQWRKQDYSNGLFAESGGEIRLVTDFLNAADGVVKIAARENKAERFWIIDTERQIYRCAAPDCEGRLRFADFTDGAQSPDYLLYDKNAGRILEKTGTVWLYCGYGEGSAVPVNGGAVAAADFDKGKEEGEYLDFVSFSEGGEKYDAWLRWEFMIVGGKLYSVIDVSVPVHCEISLAEASGAPVTGAATAVWSGFSFTELGGGSYRIDAALSALREPVRIETANAAFWLYFDAPSEGWRFDEEARVFRAAFTLPERAGFCLALHFYPLEILEISCEDPDFAVYDMGNREYYVNAPVAGSAEITIRYVDTYLPDGTPRVQTIVKTLNTGEILLSGGMAQIEKT